MIRTSYLVLFIVLISIGVGTASALITITLAGDVVIEGDLDMTNGKISNVVTPSVSSDAATKGYVDSAPGTDTLALLDCDDGEIAKVNGTVWTCVQDIGNKILATCPNQLELLSILPDFDLDQECFEGYDLGMTITGPNNIIALNTYNVTVFNHGPDIFMLENGVYITYDSQGNVIQEPFPVGCSGTSSDLTCQIPSLMADEEVLFQFVQQIKEEPSLNFCLQVVNMYGAKHLSIPSGFVPSIGPYSGCIQFEAT